MTGRGSPGGRILSALALLIAMTMLRKAHDLWVWWQARRARRASALKRATSG